ncbi:MAG: hypothetical protein JSW00_13285 [Thermoplasmata archaeon]|nr:MAG: hypothetical protein JSW00_13285 [Thermoplasmata archaeon]
MKKPSKKKVTAILLLIALLIAMFPEVHSDTISTKPPPDWGIYNAMEDIQDEKNSRINDPEIVNETKGRFDNITIISGEEKVDLTAGRDIVTPNIPVPNMLEILETMMSWPNTYRFQIIDLLLNKPLSYYIYTKYTNTTSVNESLTKANLRPNLGFDLENGWLEPNFDLWYPVDVDNDSVEDIEVFFEPLPNRFYLGSGQLLNRELGVTLWFRVRKLNDAPFDETIFKNLEIYVTKYISYAGQNFLLFIGLDLENVVSLLDTTVQVDAIQFGNIDFDPFTLTINAADILNLRGPYSIGWNIHKEDDYPLDDLKSLSLEIATVRLRSANDTYYFLNRSWIDIDFTPHGSDDYVPHKAKLTVEADDDISSFDEIIWDAQDNCDASVQFFDSQENVSYAEIEIINLPRLAHMYMTVEERGGENITIVDWDAQGIVERLTVHHYEYFDVEYEDITQFAILTGDVEYIHLFLNIQGLPAELHIEGIFYLEEIDDPPPIGIGTQISEQLLNVLVYRVLSRFTRIAKTLSSIPYRLISMAEDGSFATIDTHGKDDINEIEFIFTSGDYATTSGNFFSFYNNTRYSEYPIAQISLAGRISKIWYFNASFDQVAYADIQIMSNEPFRAIYADNINFLNAEVSVSNVPGTISIRKSIQMLRYIGSSTVDELRFISDYQGSYMDFRVRDLSDFIYLELGDERSYVSTVGGNIGEVEFLVTSGPIMRMNGNHLLLRQEQDYSLISGRIKDVSSLEYISGENGSIEVLFTQENAINISLNDTRGEGISADLIIDPLPSSISVNLSGLFSTDNGVFTPPQLDTSGVMGFAEIIFGFATLGNEILKIIDDATHDALSNVGNIIENLSFSYRTTTHITLIGKILRGKTYTLEDVDWVHGISGRQESTSNQTAMAAKLYFTGLPTEASMATKIQGDDIFLDFHLKDYTPIHDWLLIDVKGLRDRDVMLYLNDIPSKMDLDLSVDLTASFSTIPQSADGSIRMDSDKPIGSLYGRMRQTIPEITISEIFLDTVPKTLDCEFNLSGNVGIMFNANIGIEYLFIKNTKSRDDEFHDIYAILHEVPEEMVLSVVPAIDYDIDGSLLQTLPTLDMYSSGDTLDAYILADGKGIGQVGVVELQVVNAPSTLTGSFSGDKYRVKSAGVDYLWIHVMDLPIMKDHETKSIELVGKDIMSFDINVDQIFGNYPVIGIENTKGGEIQVVLDHEVDGSKVGLALVDFQIKGGLPQSPKILINGGSIDLDKDSSHVIIPAPVLTLFLSVFS